MIKRLFITSIVLCVLLTFFSCNKNDTTDSDTAGSDVTKSSQISRKMLDQAGTPDSDSEMGEYEKGGDSDENIRP